MRRALLVLEDGTSFDGIAFGSEAEVFGEVVFNTSMSGYQEVLTDPSYDGQIVTMTYPHIGNYGINDEDSESSKPRVNGFVIRDLPRAWSSWRGVKGIEEYLAENSIAGITEVDTRRLTRHIRDKGAMRGVISSTDLDGESLARRAASHPSIVGADLVRNVTTEQPYEWPSLPNARFRVAAYDFGIKFNILRMLNDHGCAVTIYPAATPAAEIVSSAPHGVFLSNGPGDPEAVGYAIENVGALIGKLPLFGICLGHQLMSLAAGFRTFKLPFGHRGINHPVLRIEDGAIEITTQNHGFAVMSEDLGFARPQGPGSELFETVPVATAHGRVKLTHVNLNDYTVEGLAFLDQNAFCVQYHPEAGPGPHDSRYLFERFTTAMEKG